MRTLTFLALTSIMSLNLWASGNEVLLKCSPLITQNEVEMDEISFGVRCDLTRCHLQYSFATDTNHSGEIELIKMKSKSKDVLSFHTPDKKVIVDMTTDLRVASINFLNAVSATCSQDLSSNPVR